jgi:3-methylcrotonyl-CoA carboxylase alpha subunit
MTGRVVQVLVKAGDAVEMGASLVVLEAMKMEYRLTAPRAGEVERVSCREGELVDLHAILVTLCR